MSGDERQPYRKPTTAPSAKDVENLAAWDALVDKSIERTTASAEKWYTGLAGFVTVITSVLLFKGPESAQAMASPWNLVVIALLVIGAALIIAGFWSALSASAPPNPRNSYEGVIAEFGTIRNLEISTASRSDGQLKRAKLLVLAALVALVAAIVLWWLAPGADDSTTVVVETSSGELCGELVASHDGYLLVLTPGADDPMTVRLREVMSIDLVDECRHSSS